MIGAPDASGAMRFGNGAPESPLGRRSLCDDDEALAARQENQPAGSAVALTGAMGLQRLSEAGYRELQRFGDFDLKTANWVLTPAAIRRLGGALFCDRRDGRVAARHNGAPTRDAARGFRVVLSV